MDLYQKINRQYEEQRRRNLELEKNRQEEIYEKIPSIREIDSFIQKLGFEGAMEQIKNPNVDSAQKIGDEIQHLKGEKKKLLEKHNYPSNYLEPQYYCTDCHDMGLLASGDRCHCFKQKLSHELYQMSNIAHVLERENFNTFNLNLFSEVVDPQEKISPKENMRRILQSVRQYIKTFKVPNDYNFIFYGATGQGKTFMLNCIAKELMDLNVNVIYQTAFEMIEICENKKFDKDPLAKEQYRLFFHADLLIVDDLGIEFVNSFTNSEIFNIINTRLLRGKKTLISTNLSPKELSETYSDRVFSRVFQKFMPIKFFGEDLRWQK